VIGATHPTLGNQKSLWAALRLACCNSRPPRFRRFVRLESPRLGLPSYEAIPSMQRTAQFVSFRKPVGMSLTKLPPGCFPELRFPDCPPFGRATGSRFHRVMIPATIHKA
jgi:hypothetical protein